MDFSAALNKFKDFLSQVLPVSPFQPYLSQWRGLRWLGWLNWFIPVKACLIVFASWLAALVLYYLYRIILRWIKAVT
jgi:hypothetical protein